MEKCPVDHHKNKDGCPVDHSGTSASPWSAINERNMMPAPNQKPAPGQRVPLDKSRVRSSIPKGDYNPKHQEGLFFPPHPNRQSSWLTINRITRTPSSRCCRRWQMDISIGADVLQCDEAKRVQPERRRHADCGGDPQRRKREVVA